MDDLLDLSWSAKPPPPARSPQPAFELLARPPPQPAAKPPTPAPPPARPPATAPPPAHSDAFSSLLAIPAARPAEPAKDMTMAQKQAAIAEERRRRDEAQRKQFEADGAFWENLGSRSSAATSASSRSNHGTFWDQYGDDGDLLSAGSNPVSQPRSHAHSPAPLPPAHTDPFDFDAFENTLNGSAKAALASEASNSGETSAIRTPVSNVDLWDGDGNDDDLLGELGRPAASKPAQTKVCTNSYAQTDDRCFPANIQSVHASPHPSRTSTRVSSTPYCRPDCRNGLCPYASSAGARKDVNRYRRPGSSRAASR